MDRRAAGALLALAACIACSAAAPTASNHTALDLYDAAPEGCYYNFQHYGEGDRIMTNEPCLNCTCHNRMLMCYLRVCPFTKAIGQDCTVEKRADQCCPIVTCPDVPVDLLTSTSTSSPAEYGATGVGKLDKYGCSIHGKYFSEGSKVPSTPNKPCEHCYCIRNMTTCVMQECTLHVDGCTPIYHKDVCCPVRYSCDHQEDETLLLDDMTTTVRPTPGFLLTTTTMATVTQMTQDCVHDDKIFADGALIKTEKACEHCYCMKGDIVCVVQECGTPMENEGKNCTSLPPREGQCCPDTYICEGDELNTELPDEFTTEPILEEQTTLSPPRRVGIEGSGYRNEPDDIPHTEMPFTEPESEGSGDEHIREKPQDTSDKQTPGITEEQLETTEGAPQISFTKSPVTDKSEKETTEYVSEQLHEHMPSTTIIPRLEEHEKTTAEPIDEEGTTSSAVESPKPHKYVPSMTDAPQLDIEKETILPERQEVVTEGITEEESAEPHKHIPPTTSATAIEEIEEATTKPESGQDYITEGISEEHSSVPHKYIPLTTIAPAIAEIEKIETTKGDGLDYITEGISEEDIAVPHKHIPLTTSVPAIEEIEEGTTKADDHHYITEGISEKDSAVPHKHIPFTTSAPTIEEMEETTSKADVQEYITEGISEEDSTVPHKDIPSATTVPAIEEIEEATTKAAGHDYFTGGISEEDSAVTHKYIPSTTSAPAIEEMEETTSKADVQEYITEGISEEDSNVPHKHIPSATTAPAIGEIEEATTKPESGQDYITEGISEEDSSVPHKYIPLTTIAPAIAEIEKVTTKGDGLDYITEGISEEDIAVPHQHIPLTTSVPAIEDIEEGTTKVDSQEYTNEGILKEDNAMPHKHISPLTSTPAIEEVEGVTTKPDDQDYITEGISGEDSVVPHKHIPVTTSAPTIEEINEASTKADSQDYITEGISEEDIYKPHKYITSTTDTPIPEKESVTTELNKESQQDSTEISEESSKHGEYIPSSTSTLFLEEIEKATTETYNAHDIVTSDAGEKEPHLFTTAKPTLDESVKGSAANKDIDISSDGTTEQEDMETYEHVTSATRVPMLEEVEKVTTVSHEEKSITTRIPEDQRNERHKYVPSTTSAHALDENIRVTTETDRESITHGIAEITESDKYIPDKPTSSSPIEEIEKATTELDGHFESHEHITTEINKKEDDDDDGNSEPNIFESNLSSTTSIPALEGHITTSEIDQENIITHEVPEGVYLETHKHISSTTSVPSFEESEKAVTEPDRILTDEITEKEGSEQQKLITTKAPTVEENEMLTTDTYKEEDLISSEITTEQSSKPIENYYVPSASSTPFLEEIERASTGSYEDHITDRVTEHASYEPHKHETSTVIIEDVEVTSEPDKGINTIPNGISEESIEDSSESSVTEKTVLLEESKETEPIQPTEEIDNKEDYDAHRTTIGVPMYFTSPQDNIVTKEDHYAVTTEPTFRKEDDISVQTDSQNKLGSTTETSDHIQGVTLTSQLETKETTIGELEPTILLDTSKVTSHEGQETSTEKLDSPVTITVDTTTRNQEENEIHEGRIPGEGDCLLNGVTYRNESVMPNTDKCTSGCRCISSIIKCDPIICSPPPEYMDNCQPIYDSPESCCPTYVCDQLRETLPPLPHIQVTTPAKSEQTSPADCEGNQCELNEDERQPTITADEKADTTKCESQDCVEGIQVPVHTISSTLPELCADGKCTPTGESCANGQCPEQVVPVTPCEGDNCKTVPETESHVTQACENDELCKEIKTPETSATPCEGESCTSIKEDCISGDCVTNIISPSQDTQKVDCHAQNGCEETQDKMTQQCADGSCNRKEAPDTEGKPSQCSGPDCGHPVISPTQDTYTEKNIDESILDHTTPEQTTQSSFVTQSQEMKTGIPESHVTEKPSIETELLEHATISATEKTAEQTKVPELQESFTSIPDIIPEFTHKSPVSDDNKEPEVITPQPNIKLPETETSGYSTPESAVSEEITQQSLLDIKKGILTTMAPEAFATESQEIHTNLPDTHIEETNAAETMSPEEEVHSGSETHVTEGQEYTTKMTYEQEIHTEQPNIFITEEKDSSLVTESHETSTVLHELIITEHQEFTTKTPEQDKSELPHSYVTEPQEHIAEVEDKVSESPQVTKLEIVTKTPEVASSEEETSTKREQEITTESAVTKLQESPVTTTEPTERVTKLQESIAETSVQPEYTYEMAVHTEKEISTEQELSTKASLPVVTVANEESPTTPIKEPELQEPSTNAMEENMTGQKTFTTTIPPTEEAIELTTPGKALESDQEKSSSERPELHVTDIVELATEAYVTEKEQIPTKVEQEPSLTKPQESDLNEPHEEISSNPPVSSVEENLTTESQISKEEKKETEPPVYLETEPVTQTYKQEIDEIRTVLPESFATEVHDKATESPYVSEKEQIHTNTSPQIVKDVTEEQITEHEMKTELPEVFSSEKEEHKTEIPISFVNQPEKIFTDREDIYTTEQDGSVTEKIIPSVTEDKTDIKIPDVAKETPESSISHSEVPIDSTEKTVLYPHEISTISNVGVSTERQEFVTEELVAPDTETVIPDIHESSTESTQTEKSIEAESPEKVTMGEEHKKITVTPEFETSTHTGIPEYISTQSQEVEIQTELSMFNTKAPEIATTEQFEKVADINKSTVTDTLETYTEKVSNVEEDIHTETNIITEPQEITNAPSFDMTGQEHAIAEIPEKSDIEHDLSSKGPEELEIYTHIPESHFTVPSEEHSESSEIPISVITEPQETSTKPKEITVTEPQRSVTELPETSTMKHIGIDDGETTLATSEDLETEVHTVTDGQKVATELPTTLGMRTEIPDLEPTTVESQVIVTDHKGITVVPEVSVISEDVSSESTEKTHRITHIPESLITEPQEISTSSPHVHISDQKDSQTIPPKTVEPVETSTKIADQEDAEFEEKITKAPEELITEKQDAVPNLHESHTVPQETATEISGLIEISTELPKPDQKSTESPAQSEHASAPIYEYPETTPYPIELEEHTHSIPEEISTISSAEKEKATVHLESEKTKDGQLMSEMTTEKYTDELTGIIKETDQVQEETPTPTGYQVTESEQGPETSTLHPVSIEETFSPKTESHDDKKHTIIEQDKEITPAPTQYTEMERVPSADSGITEQTERVSVTTSVTETPLEPSIPVKITTPEEELVFATTQATTAKIEEALTQSPVPVDKFTEPEKEPSKTSSTVPELPKPVPSEAQPTNEVPLPEEEGHFPPSGSSGYGGDTDYVEEGQPFGPGTCRYGGKVYVSAQQIPRDDPCDFCFCFRSDIICLQQSCPPPIHGCHEEPIQGFCCPRYECPVSMATTLNVTTTTTTTTTTLPPHFPTHSYKGAAQRRGCQIKGHTYKVGEVVRASSGPCLHCTCGGDGQMKCDPKACTPEPMLRQMIAAAVSAKRRR